MIPNMKRVVAVLLLCLAAVVPSLAMAAPPPPTRMDAPLEARRARLAAGFNQSQRAKLENAVREVRKRAGEAPAIVAGKPPVPVDVAAFARESATSALGSIESQKIEEILVYVLLEAARMEEAALRDLLAEMKAASEKKAALRAWMTATKNNGCTKLNCVDAIPSSSEYPREALEMVRKSLATVPAAKRQTSLTEQSELVQTQMQMFMDRRSKALEALTIILKQISGSSAAVTQNLK